MELSTTSYALLGLLSLRPWTTYELAQQAKRSLRLMWPVAERQLYEHPKVLVRHGLATVRKETTGARRRSVYDITPQGQEALRSWLEATEGAFEIRSEFLLRIFFAEQGSKTAMLAQVEVLAERMNHAWSRQVDLYEADRAAGLVGGPFPARRHINAINMALMFELGSAIQRWATWVRSTTDAWPEDLAVPDGADELLDEVFARDYPTARPS